MSWLLELCAAVGEDRDTPASHDVLCDFQSWAECAFVLCVETEFSVELLNKKKIGVPKIVTR